MHEYNDNIFIIAGIRQRTPPFHRREQDMRDCWGVKNVTRIVEPRQCHLQSIVS